LTAMNIFEFGMQMEKDGEAYYRELAGKCGNRGLETIFTMLADSDVKHFNTLKEMAGTEGSSLPGSTLLADVKNVFVEMREQEKEFDFDISQIDLYRKAQELEKKSEAFYRERSSAAENQSQKEIFEAMATEEKQHAALLENLIDFVSRPATWLENAEWHNMEEY